MQNRATGRSSDRNPANLFGWAGGIVFAAALLAGATILHFQDQQAPKPVAGPLEPLRIGIARSPTCGLIFVALAKGYFRDEGLEVTTKVYPSGKRALKEGLFTGEVDIASSGDVPVAMAAFDRHDIKAIATTFNVDNVNRIIARRDSGIARPSDLRGKRVATQGASAVHFFLHLFLLEHGISEGDVALHFMKAERLPKALAEGRIDAFSMREPFISEARELLGDNAVVFEAPGLYSQTEIVVAAGELIKNRPGVVTRVLRALLRAETFMTANPEEAIAITAERLGVEAEEIAIIWPTVKFRMALGQPLLLRLENEARWAIGANIVNNGDVPNYLDFIHLDALADLKPEAVTIIR